MKPFDAWDGQKEISFDPPGATRGVPVSPRLRTWWRRDCRNMYKEDRRWAIVPSPVIIIFSHHHGPTALLAGGSHRHSF